ncbi:MAG TPA: protein-L-isoaspartate(D-aspartate) O-methyltransferase [Beijerinckiaceae bacterium]|nr:protein-L-isoaspartate(D-aspartate) O-methyltransferase [Beijerinckiaceae bacterium]HVB89883.1 protein-L-isoaspartate(D-aspartate) O-methyltransferase [Beijerinckiaceae bacterium]
MKAPGDRPQPVLPGLFEEREGAAQETMAFLLRLRARGIADVSVLRALETVPRLAFVSHRYADLALRDMALPISCGQTIPEPYLVARTLEALDLEPSHRVLEIGTGSGYSTALLARLAGEVISYERFQTLALEARIRLARLGVTNARVIWGDGLAEAANEGLFDRILLQGSLKGALPTAVMDLLGARGVAIYGRTGDGAPGEFVRIADCDGGLTESVVGLCRTGPLVPGKSLSL